MRGCGVVLCHVRFLKVLYCTGILLFPESQREGNRWVACPEPMRQPYMSCAAAESDHVIVDIPSSFFWESGLGSRKNYFYCLVMPHAHSSL